VRKAKRKEEGYVRLDIGKQDPEQTRKWKRRTLWIDHPPEPRSEKADAGEEREKSSVLGYTHINARTSR